MAGAELPCLIVNVMRGGPGLGTIQPSQADYFQTVKGGGHGDYRLITLAPASVQEMANFVKLGFDLAFKYRNPAIILADGVIGQMMEKVVLPPFQPRLTEAEIRQARPWATQGKPAGRKRNVITSLELDPARMEENNLRFQAKYREIEKHEVRYEELNCTDIDYLMVAFGSMARICQKTQEMAAAEGIKIGLFASHHAVAFPVGCHRQLRRQGQRHLGSRTQCRPNDRRCAPGRKRTRKSRALRPSGRHRSDPRRSSRRPQRETHVKRDKLWKQMILSNPKTSFTASPAC